MKKLLTIVFILSFVSSGMAWPWDKKTAAKSEIKKPLPVKVETGSSLQQAKQVIKELSAELNAAKSENVKLKINLENADKKVEAAVSGTAVVQKQADALRAWGIERQNEAFEWMSKHSKTLKKYHRLKTVASIVGGIFGLVFGIFCMRFVPPVYAAYAFALPIACTVIASGWVWIFF